MANTKISALSSASTPLSGSEIVPVNQSGVTDSVSVANLTAGREVATAGVSFAQNDSAFAAGKITYHSVVGLVVRGNTASVFDFSIYSPDGTAVLTQQTGTYNLTAQYDFKYSGNLVQNTAGKGINFTANTPASGMTSQNLTWYEEGTWTPNLNYGWTKTGTVTTSGTYTRIGRQVFVTVKITASGGGTVSMNQANINNLPYTAANPALGAWGVDSNYGAATQTQNVLVDGTVMYFTGAWTGVANYVYVASATYTV